MSIDKLLKKHNHKNIVVFAYDIVKYDKLLLQEINNDKLSYEEKRYKITRTFAKLKTCSVSFHIYFYRQLVLEEISFDTFDGIKQKYQENNPNEDTSGSFVESYIMSALDREAIVLTKQSFNRFVRTFFLVEAYRMKPLKYLNDKMNLENDVENAKNGKVELITDIICKDFDKPFSDKYIYDDYIKNNDTTRYDSFWGVL